MIVKTHRVNSLKLLLECQGSIVLAITPKILFAAGIGALAALIEHGVLGGNAEDAFDFSFTPFTALGVAISLFLGFHNNASYGRWWEARTLWGAQIIAVRNLHRFLRAACSGVHDAQQQQQTTVDDGGGENDWRTRIMLLFIAQTHALRAQLRPCCRADGTRTAVMDRDSYLSEEEYSIISKSRNPANAILLYIGDIIASRAKPELDSFTLVQLTRHIDEICAIQAGCERIHNTSLPLAYSLLVHRTTFLYVILAPFAMAQSMHWWTPLFSAILAYTFFGLDELARQIQEPFRDEPNALALSAMCRVVEIDVLEGLGRQPPPALVAEKSVLM
jgi:putative membrane protein